MDEVKMAVAKIVHKINSGQAPAELETLYQNMKPADFGFWLHGFAYGVSQDKALRASKLHRFLRKEILSV